MFICSICQRDFKSKRSLQSHTNHHNPEYREKSKTGALNSQENARAASELIYQERIKNYNHNPKKCKHCGNDINYEKRNNEFCNSSCSATYNNNNRNEIFYKENGIKIKQHYIDNPIEPKPKPINQCMICDSNFEANNEDIQTCSKSCMHKLLSIRQQERIENGWNPNDNRGKGKRSYMEKSFEDWIIKHNIFDYHTEYRFHNSEDKKNYFVDFYFPHLNLVIELDGSQHKNTIEADKRRDQYLLEIYGIVVERITENEYKKQSKKDYIKILLKIE